MGEKIPFIGTLLFLRISFKDIYEGGQLMGVQYHYEVVAGTHQQNYIAKKINQKILGNFQE